MEEVSTRNPAAAVMGHVCDVTNEESVRSSFEHICADGARIDALVCNAGISSVGQVVEATGPEMDRVYAVNVRGVFHCLKHGASSGMP